MLCSVRLHDSKPARIEREYLFIFFPFSSSLLISETFCHSYSEQSFATAIAVQLFHIMHRHKINKLILQNLECRLDAPPLQTNHTKRCKPDKSHQAHKSLMNNHFNHTAFEFCLYLFISYRLQNFYDWDTTKMKK